MLPLACDRQAQADETDVADAAGAVDAADVAGADDA